MTDERKLISAEMCFIRWTTNYKLTNEQMLTCLQISSILDFMHHC